MLYGLLVFAAMGNAFAARRAASGDDMIRHRRGKFRLDSGGERLGGEYIFDAGSLRVAETLESVGHFSYAPIGGQPFGEEALEGRGDEALPVVSVVDGEIMAAIQDPRNEGAFFVLPSQLNGAEYPSSSRVVSRIQDYVQDNTGGPRGQLAVHPAAGQFVLDNAARSRHPGGINAVDGILQAASEFGFALENGYLRMPEASSDAQADQMLAAVRSRLHTLRPLMMSGVPASGMLPSLRGLSRASHSVGLVYASAVPLNAYMNHAARGSPSDRLHRKVAAGVLTAQYYGAMARIAADPELAKPAVVYLMPLGGGVFNNPAGSIAKSIALAVERLSAEGRLEALDIRVLAWERNLREGEEMRRLLQGLGKLRASGR